MNFIKGGPTGSMIGVIFGLVFGAIVGLVIVPTSGLNVDKEYLYVLLSCLIFAVVLGVVFGIIRGIAKGIERVDLIAQTVPNQGIRQAINNSLIGIVVGLAIGVLISFVLSVLFNATELSLWLPFGLSLDSVIGLFLAIILGGYAVLNHYTLRFILFRGKYMPWRYVKFLDFATERVFLYRVGGGYIFVHRLLMEHFAAMYTEDEK